MLLRSLCIHRLEIKAEGKMRSSAGWTVEMPDACGQRSDMGDQEGFELDVEGTAEFG